MFSTKSEGDKMTQDMKLNLNAFIEQNENVFKKFGFNKHPYCSLKQAKKLSAEEYPNGRFRYIEKSKWITIKREGVISDSLVNKETGDIYWYHGKKLVGNLNDNKGALAAALKIRQHWQQVTGANPVKYITNEHIARV